MIFKLIINWNLYRMRELHEPPKKEGAPVRFVLGPATPNTF
jgi:hypothetical protein